MPARIVQKGQSKYRNRAVVIDGVRFASQKEGRRYTELKALLAAGKIADLELQPPFPVIVSGVRVCVYKADFTYMDLTTGKQKVEDAKGFRTPLYKLKKKLVEALYGITILEV